jgi:hypothetical protein
VDLSQTSVTHYRGLVRMDEGVAGMLHVNASVLVESYLPSDGVTATSLVSAPALGGYGGIICCLIISRKHFDYHIAVALIHPTRSCMCLLLAFA